MMYRRLTTYNNNNCIPVLLLPVLLLVFVIICDVRSRSSQHLVADAFIVRTPQSSRSLLSTSTTSTGFFTAKTNPFPSFPFQSSSASSSSSSSLYALSSSSSSSSGTGIDTDTRSFEKTSNIPDFLLPLASSDDSVDIIDNSSRLIQGDNNNNDNNNSPNPNKEDNNDKIWKARYLLIGAAALYGTNFSLVKILGDSMPEGVSLTLRFSLAALVTLPWLFEGMQQPPEQPREQQLEGIIDTNTDTDTAITTNNINNNNSNNADLWMATWLGFEVGLWNSIGYVAQAVGLETTPASKSAFICSLAVVVVPLLDFVTGKRIQQKQWIGAILAVIGVAFLELTGTTDGGTTPGTITGAVATHMPLLSKGDLLSLVQPFAFGIGFWKVEKALHQYPLEARRLTAAQLLAVFMASVCYGLSAIPLDTLQSYPWSDWFTNPQLLFSIFWTGVITTALTIYMENKAMETLSASEATVIFATEPIWGTAFAAVVMSEQLGINSAIGAFFILSACFYSNQGMGGLTGLAQGVNKNLKIVPVKVQHQMASFATSVAASWASWNVAVSSAVAEDLPDVDLDGLDNVLEDIVDILTKNLPW